VDAVRSDRWKLFVKRKGKPVAELYDLARDLGETTNVAEERPEVVARLRRKVEHFRPALQDTTRPTARVEGEGGPPQ
jgi:hypothetical protein